MSHRPKRPLPPGNRIPRNKGGTPYYDIDELHFGSWGPLPDGKGESTQVHMTISFKGGLPPFVMRFKSAAAVDEVIEALQRHRFDVWPS